MDTEADYKSQPLDITGNYANEQYIWYKSAARGEHIYNKDAEMAIM